jgi:hypothetical protein
MGNCGPHSFWTEGCAPPTGSEPEGVADLVGLHGGGPAGNLRFAGELGGRRLSECREAFILSICEGFAFICGICKLRFCTDIELATKLGHVKKHQQRYHVFGFGAKVGASTLSFVMPSFKLLSSSSWHVL